MSREYVCTPVTPDLSSAPTSSTVSSVGVGSRLGRGERRERDSGGGTCKGGRRGKEAEDRVRRPVRRHLPADTRRHKTLHVGRKSRVSDDGSGVPV